VSDGGAHLTDPNDGAPASRILRRLTSRPAVDGKFLRLGAERFFVRGVTYGPFSSTRDSGGFPSRDAVRRDFETMADNRINGIRTYTVPPGWLLDLASERGLYVMVSLPWEQHVAFLDYRELAPSIEKRVRAGVRRCAGHPAVLCFIDYEEPTPPSLRSRRSYSSSKTRPRMLSHILCGMT